MTVPNRYAVGKPYVDSMLNPIVPEDRLLGKPRLPVEQHVLTNQYRPTVIFAENNLTQTESFARKVMDLKNSIIADIKPFFWLTPQQQEIKQHRRSFRIQLPGEPVRSDAYHTFADSIYNECQKQQSTGNYTPSKEFDAHKF